MINQPLVSVILPVYNGEKYVKEAIYSILNQTFANFEFIIINDGSTDATEEIILSFKDERIRYIKQPNAGIGFSLRVGCTLANGKYIARMDGDDISLPDRLSKQVAFLEKNKQYILVGSAVHYINDDGKVTGRSIPYITDFSIKSSLKYASTIAHPTVMFVKEVYDKSHGYNKEINLLEDYVLWLDMSSLGKYYNLYTPLLLYRKTNISWYSKVDPIEVKKLMTEFYHLIKKDNYEGVINIYRQALPKVYYSGNKKNNVITDYNRLSFSLHWNKSLNNILYYVLSQVKLIYSYFRGFV